VSSEGITINPEKLKAVQEWLTLKNKHKIRSFLGLCTYYRRFISGFANIAVTCLPVISYYSPALKMEAICSSKMSVQTRATWCYIQEDDFLNSHHREKLKSYIAKLLTKLTERKQAFQWTPEVEATFQTLKEPLCTAPISDYL
jgi:hypothetical protein